MSSLSFIPRKLTKTTNAQKSGQPSIATSQSASFTSAPASSSTPAISTQPTAAQELPPKYDDQDYANLIALSLSDYSLWIDADLRHRLSPSVLSAGSAEDTSYISLNYLFAHSTVLKSLLDTKHERDLKAMHSKSQTAIIKGVRAHASHFLDVRLLLHPDETVPRFGKKTEVGGGYEVRRKRVGLVMKTKLEWDASTLYMENIPPGYRSYAGIIRFLNDLLHDAPPTPSSSSLLTDPLTRIQGILFPPHLHDKPETQPSCKGFALVTFNHAADCEYMKFRWPSIRVTSRRSESEAVEADKEKEADSATEISCLARQYDFRVITKKRWLQLKAEYLTYRQKLVDEMNAYQDTRQHPPRNTRVSDMPDIMSTMPAVSLSDVKTTKLSLSPSSPYPPSCLAFVKHVHPETTKTTLRSLLSQAFNSQDAQLSEKNHEGGLDYVDFNKGMDTCYLRLTTPAYTAALVDYFNHRTYKVIQVSGMDETGRKVTVDDASATHPNLKPIVVERVIGRPEEIYWEKVPIKVKKAAVEKAIQLMGNGEEGHGRKRPPEADDAESSSRDKRRKE